MQERPRRERRSILLQFLSDNQKNPSSMRLIALLSLLTAISLAWYSVLHENSVNESLIQTFLAPVLAQVGQKVFELNAEGKDASNP